MSFYQSSGGFSADAVSPSGNSAYYDLKAPAGTPKLFEPLVPEALVASATTPYYNLVTGSLQQSSSVSVAPIPYPVSDAGLGYSDSKVFGVNARGAATVPVSGAVGYGVSALQYAKNASYFVLAGAKQGDPPSIPQLPFVIPSPTVPGGQGLFAYVNVADELGEPPITYSFLYGTTSPPTTSVAASLTVSSNNNVYFAPLQPLVSNTLYYIQTVATNQFGSTKSDIISYTTPVSGTAPTGTIPAVTLVSKTDTSFTVSLDTSAVSGTPTPVIFLLVELPGKTPFAVPPVLDPPPVANSWLFTVSGLVTNQEYRVAGSASNGTDPDLLGAFSSITPGGGGGPPSQPDDPSAIPSPTTPGGQGFTFYINVAGETGDPPITYSFLYGTASPPSISVPATLTNPSLSIYSATVTGLTASTPYYVQSVATNASGSASSNIVSYTTPAAGGTAPGGTIPAPTEVSKTTNSITVTVDASAVTGTPTPSIVLVYTPPTGSPAVVSTPDFPPVANVYTFTAPGLVANTAYTLQGKAANGTAPDLLGATVVISTNAPPPPQGFKTNTVVTFLIQGPRFGQQVSDCLDYYINVDAVGCTLGDGDSAISGNQDYGYMYASSRVDPTTGPDDYTGFCVSDQPFSTTYGPINDAYFTSISVPNVNKLVCWGGFNADVLGLFGPYQPANYPSGFTNPNSTDVVKSFCYNFLGLTGGTNPLNWSRSGYTTVFDGLILDFENVGYGGIPGSDNQYPLPQSPLPSFPADAGDPKYAPYQATLGGIPADFKSFAPDKFLGNAPVSRSINSDALGGTRNGNISAANTALNTWFAFTDSTTPPSSTTFNNTESPALNHPNQMQYFDDVFVQFYNEDPDYYLGGSKFNNLLAQWGYVALQAQKKAGGARQTRINIGLARGNIIPGLIGGIGIEEAQGPTPPVDSELPAGAPYTYWYPQYATASPPNSTNATQSPQFWPNTSPSLDPQNLAASITAANKILQDGTDNPNLNPSDWCSGVGFWAGTNATAAAKSVYTAGNPISPGSVLPALYTYCWSDASYPAPSPDWPGTVPITSTL